MRTVTNDDTCVIPVYTYFVIFTTDQIENTCINVKNDL